MRYVCYVRKTSFDPTDKSPCDITVQTEHIRSYARKRGWGISRKYSDRIIDPKANDEFVEMKQAAIRREFDCIIVDSISVFGPDAYQTLRFLRNTYYPAGLHFAVAEDDFCSMDHTDEEVYAYINDKRSFIHGRMTAVYMKEAAVESYFSAYGFRYDRDAHRVEKDEASARIIVEVFERLRTGELPASIARDMTRRGIETPGNYYYRQRGWRPKKADPAWTTQSVRAISTNPKYMGRWECKYDIADLDIRCGTIVEPELYEAVQQVYASRFDHKSGGRKPAPYINLIFDKDTGTKLRYFTRYRTGENDIRFRDVDAAEDQYERSSMPYDEFHERVVRQMLREKQSAVKALNMIESKSGSIRKEREIQEAKKTFRAIFAEMAALEQMKMDEYRRYQKGEIGYDTFLLKEKETAGELGLLDRKVESLTAELDEIEKIYSDRNPWIRLFSGLEEEDAMARKKIKKLVEKVLVCRFESVELIPKEQKWKKALPAEWFEEDGNG